MSCFTCGYCLSSLYFEIEKKKDEIENMNLSNKEKKMRFTEFFNKRFPISSEKDDLEKDTYPECCRIRLLTRMPKEKVIT